MSAPCCIYLLAVCLVGGGTSFTGGPSVVETSFARAFACTTLPLPFAIHLIYRCSHLEEAAFNMLMGREHNLSNGRGPAGHYLVTIFLEAS